MKQAFFVCIGAGRDDVVKRLEEFVEELKIRLAQSKELGEPFTRISGYSGEPNNYSFEGEFMKADEPSLNWLEWSHYNDSDDEYC